MIGSKVHVIIDRPLGSVHPKYKDLVYEVNYGYVPNIIGGDGEEQDAYVLGVDQPIKEFDGIVIAIIHRSDDNETKWIVTPENMNFSDEDIIQSTEFQEKYFNVTISRNKSALQF